MLDIVKIFLAPMLKLLESFFNRDNYKLKQLRLLNTNDQPEYYSIFLIRRKREIGFKQQTGINTNYKAIEKILVLYDEIAMKTNCSLKTLKMIEDFIDVSEEKAFIKVTSTQKVLGFLLYVFSLIMLLVLSGVLLLSSFSFDIDVILTIFVYISFCFYFFIIASPTIEAIRIKKILEKHT